MNNGNCVNIVTNRSCQPAGTIGLAIVYKVDSYKLYKVLKFRSWKTFVLGLEYSKPCPLSETKGMVVDCVLIK